MAPLDLFISHAWRFHDDWTRLVEMLDQSGRPWRNFSVPWHDPAIDPNTEIGGPRVRQWLKNQILPVQAVIVLDSVFGVGSGRKWIDFELAVARRTGKTVIALPTFGADTVSPELAAQADRCGAWDIERLLATL